MSELLPPPSPYKAVVRFAYFRNLSGLNGEGNCDFFLPEVDKEYPVTIEESSKSHIIMTLADNGFKMSFYPPGVSTKYTVVRHGWEGIAQPAFPTVPAFSRPILDSVVTLDLKPISLDLAVKRIVYRLPRTINGVLVNRNYCLSEIMLTLDGTPEFVGEICGKASFVLSPTATRYVCTHFQVRNISQRKNLTTPTGRPIVPSTV